MNYLVSFLIGYLIGSFPTAYLLLKKLKNLDITSEGTGNVGAMNSFDVTKSKLIGVSVLFIDLLKGMLPIFIIKIILTTDFTLFAIALIGCVFSHCYNPWLQLKGGRGLASAAGGCAIIFPFALVVWAILWVIFNLIRKNATIANVTASVMTLIIVMTSSEIAMKYAFPKPESVSTLILFSTGLMLIIISKHTEPLQELLEQTKTSRRKI